MSIGSIRIKVVIIMAFRIFKKSFLLTWRAKKRFFAFVLIYTVLITMTALGLESDSLFTVLVASAGGVAVATVYGFLLTSFRKKEIATLKCIGWSNNDIRKLVIGEIFTITLLAFLILLEALIHVVGFDAYVSEGLNAPITPTNLLISLGLIGALQVPGIMISNLKLLKVKPIVALKA